MIKYLSIQNIALIKSMSIDFSQGLTVLTGETGAGKSLFLDALAFVLGAKADKSLVSHGESKARVDAMFDVNEYVSAIVQELGYECDCGELMLSRTLTSEGRSEVRINGKVATASILKAITSHIVDIHGQNEQQSLLKTSSHIQLIDRFGGEAIASLLEDIAEKYEKIQEYKKEIAKLGGSTEERMREIDILRFQVDEIADAQLSQDEEIELEKKMKLAQNQEKLTQSLQNSIALLDSNHLSNIARGAKEINSLSAFDESFSSLSERTQSAYYELQDIYDELSAYLDQNSISEREIDEIIERAETYKKLQRKYGKTTEDVLQFASTASKRLHDLENCEEMLVLLQERLEKARKAYFATAEKLTQERKKSAQNLISQTQDILRDLCMNGVAFEVDFNTTDPAKNGVDEIEFLFSANKGEPLKPLAKIISGGEMSRITLALKVVLADIDNVDTMIFDEIDTGISGQVGEAVACKLAKLSKKQQVICISHLPYITAMADSHFKIYKSTENNSTQTHIESLDADGMIAEISRLVGGTSVSTHSLSHSAELKEWCTKYKESL